MQIIKNCYLTTASTL